MMQLHVFKRNHWFSSKEVKSTHSWQWLHCTQRYCHCILIVHLPFLLALCYIYRLIVLYLWWKSLKSFLPNRSAGSPPSGTLNTTTPVTVVRQLFAIFVVFFSSLPNRLGDLKNYVTHKALPLPGCLTYVSVVTMRSARRRFPPQWEEASRQIGKTQYQHLY